MLLIVVPVCNELVIVLFVGMGGALVIVWVDKALLILDIGWVIISTLEDVMLVF